MHRKGFTLLEVLVATTLMAIAVVGLLANLRTSLSNAARLSDYDRAAVLARRQMDVLLTADALPKGEPIAGLFEPSATGGVRAGWQARVTPFEGPTGAGAPAPPGSKVLDRIQLEVWWMQGDKRRTLHVAAYKRNIVRPEEAAAYAAFAGEMVP